MRRSAIDHFIWVVKPENLDSYVRQLSSLFETEFEHMDGAAYGKWPRGLALHAYVSWDSGLELIAPTGERDPVSSRFLDFLSERGEGPYGFVLNVPDLDRSLERARELGYPVEDPLQPADPEKRQRALHAWTSRLLDLREAYVGEIANAGVFMGEVRYRP